MKKILTLLLFLLITTYGFSQSVYVRAYSFCIGINNDSTGKRDWGQPNKSNVLIRYNDNAITIYSKEEQVYRTIGVGETLTESTKFLCVDPDGKKCFAYLGHNLETNTLYLLIEYSDISWIYLTKSEN